MAADDQSLTSIYKEAEQKRYTIENGSDSNSVAFQENIASAINLYSQCIHIAQRIPLFSANETLEDISSADLKYLLLHYHTAELIIRLNDRQSREGNLLRAQQSYERFLRQLDSYDILPTYDSRLLEQYRESPRTFSTVSSNDPTTRRTVKIQRFQQEKALKQKLQYLKQNPQTLQNNDDVYRELQLTNIAYCAHQSFQSLESIGAELHILSLKPSSPLPDLPDQHPDLRERDQRNVEQYSERLDSPISKLSGAKGPILDSKGKPLRPFTLLGKRQEFRDGVFRPDHSLPTMTIDEYLEEERRRGGMIDGGGPQSQVQPQVDEDDMEAADRETMKAREWDEYTEANPRGSGNTLNRG